MTPDRSSVWPDLIEPSLSEVGSLVATFENAREPFRRRLPARWSVGENIEHLRLAVRPINLALILPRFTLRIFGWGRAGRPYDEVVRAYQVLLAKGARASRPFVPPSLDLPTNQRDLIGPFREAYATYALRLGGVKESHLDSIRLPHPILGLLSLREMASFTLYHLRHHHDAIRREAGIP